MPATQKSSRPRAPRRGRAATASPPAAVFAVDDASEVAPIHSPARAIQGDLARAFDADPAERWSGRKTLLFIAGTCGGFWLFVGAAVAVLRR